ncbi:hypothetical protein TNCV_4773951 [Trichonephila clavipes]|nr:hypothetical protein TNCV_4773951 [Trichonephila clavipes]
MRWGREKKWKSRCSLDILWEGDYYRMAPSCFALREGRRPYAACGVPLPHGVLLQAAPPSRIPGNAFRCSGLQREFLNLNIRLGKSKWGCQPFAGQGRLADPSPFDPIGHDGLPVVDPISLRLFSTSSDHRLKKRGRGVFKKNVLL